MSVTVTFTCDNVMILFQEMATMLHSIPAFDTRDPVEPVSEIETKPGNVVPMAATAVELPRRRRGKGNGAPAARMMTQEEAEAEDVAEAIKQEDEELAALAPDDPAQRTRDSVIDELTIIFKGADAGTRAKIKGWRDKMGYKLIRDLTDKDLPAALKFINELAV